MSCRYPYISFEVKKPEFKKFKFSVVSDHFNYIFFNLKMYLIELQNFQNAKSHLTQI